MYYNYRHETYKLRSSTTDGGEESGAVIYQGNLIESMNGLFIACDTGSRITLANKKTLPMLGYEPKDMIGMDFLEFIDPVSGEAARIGLQAMLKGDSGSIEAWAVHRDGSKRFLKLDYAPIIEEGQVAGAIILAFDQTECKRREEAHRESQQTLTRLISNLPGMAYRCTNEKSRTMEYTSEGCLELTGFRPTIPEKKNSLHYWDIIHPDDRERVWNEIQEALKEFRPFHIEYRILTASGVEKWVWEQGRGVASKAGEMLALEGFIADISERKRAEEQLKYLSLHEPLTGLYNRTYFEQEMRRLDEGRSHPQVGIIVCDVDGLKLVNDTIGHHAGDELLLAAASVFLRSFRKGDMVARIGGDEFAVILPSSPGDVVAGACQRIRSAVEQYNANNPRLPLSISVGFGVRTEASVSMNDVFKEADNNMYLEKLHRKQSARTAIVQTLVRAMEAKEFIVEGNGNRLQDLMEAIATDLGLSQRAISDLRLLGQFHDIGKVGIPDRIIFKPGPLSPEEIAEMQRHSEIGHRIALSAPDLVPIAGWILKHHEWWNGEGYPLGIKREEIPLECRILAVANAYDAMTAHRPYRKAKTPGEAVAELKKCAGTQFDPDLVRRFIHILETRNWLN